MAQTFFVPQKRKIEGTDGPAKRKSLLPEIKERKKVENLDLEYAGDGKKEGLTEVFKYLNYRSLPERFQDVCEDLEMREKKKKFLKHCEGFFISKGFLCEYSQSKFCTYTKENSNKSERVIPYKDEIKEIIETMHIKDGEHLSKKKCIDRAIEMKIFWQGYSKDISQHIKNCHCSCDKEKQSTNKGILKLKKPRKKKDSDIKAKNLKKQKKKD